MTDEFARRYAAARFHAMRTEIEDIRNRMVDHDEAEGHLADVVYDLHLATRLLDPDSYREKSY
jgi:hypothetical protein